MAQVLCTGTGVELPGVAPAFEYAVARPVSIATAPTLAGATGAAISAQRLSAEPVGTTVRTPWPPSSTSPRPRGDGGGPRLRRSSVHFFSVASSVR